MKFNAVLLFFVSLYACMGSVRGDDTRRSTIREAVRGCDQAYTFMWWAYGWRGEKIRCLQTSSYGMAMDVESMQVTRFGHIVNPLAYEQAVAQSNDVVLNLPSAALDLSVDVGDVKYLCRAGGHPRLIESGRFLQRSDIEGLVFKSLDGAVLPATSRLEVIAWPDRLAVILQVTPLEHMSSTRATIRFSAGEHTITEASAVADWREGEVQSLPAVLCEHPPASATDVTAVQVVAADDGTPVPVRYDAAGGWHEVILPPASAVKPDAGALQRLRLHLKNAANSPRVVRLNFAREGSVEGITGLVPMLRDSQGNPTGIPVQISKNWHRQFGKTFLYQGDWLHALTMLDVPPDFDGTLEFCISRNFWGGIPVASHAQLCLIGWGTDQLWDEAAIGSWGESICYDPDVCLQRSFIDDVRPLMVRPINASEGRWGWSNNVGGGDFLVYFDGAGRKQFLTRMRTAYLSQGPNLTDVIYAGVSADGKINASLRVMTPRCDDINRAYHTFRYDVLQPVSFQRLAFYQLGADNYNDHQFRKLARGNTGGLIEEWEVQQGGGRYHRKDISCPGDMPWFSLHDAISNDKQGAWANRGLVIRSWKARLGGKDSAPFAASFGTSDGPASCNIELVPPPGLTELSPGDFVEATVELLVLPQFAKDYYGPNKKLKEDLDANENTWKPVLRYAAEGAVTATVAKGKRLEACPLRIEVDAASSADFSITGGAGCYYPVTFTHLPDYRGWKLYRLAGDTWTAIDQSVFGNDFWQVNSEAHDRYSITFNVALDAAAGSQRFRLLRKQ